MSGSSLDGLDVAVVDFNPDSSWKLLWTYEQEYSNDWVQKLKSYHQLSATEYIKFKTEYSNYIGGLLVDILRMYNPDLKGYSIGQGKVDEPGANLNVAVSGSVAQ